MPATATSNGHAMHHHDSDALAPHASAHHNRIAHLTVSASPGPGPRPCAHSRPPDPPSADSPCAPLPCAISPPFGDLELCQRLMAAFLNGNHALIEVCEEAGLSLADVYAWSRSAWALERFRMIRELSKLRDELIAADAVPQARQVLIRLATIADPSESAASRESRRKAAMALAFPPGATPRRNSSTRSRARSPQPEDAPTDSLQAPVSGAMGGAPPSEPDAPRASHSPAPEQTPVASPGCSPGNAIPLEREPQRGQDAAPMSPHAAPGATPTPHPGPGAHPSHHQRPPDDARDGA